MINLLLVLSNGGSKLGKEGGEGGGWGRAGFISLNVSLNLHLALTSSIFWYYTADHRHVYCVSENIIQFHNLVHQHCHRNEVKFEQRSSFDWRSGWHQIICYCLQTTHGWPERHKVHPDSKWHSLSEEIYGLWYPLFHINDLICSSIVSKQLAYKLSSEKYSSQVWQ